VGSDVLAAKSGIAVIGRIHNGLGRYVVIQHPDGWRTRYGHLTEITVRDRQRIRRGQKVGTVGKSGNARWKWIQPHLHFEVWTPEGVPVDPLIVMEAEQDERR
jgi:murein DD-endopeptidase MepM/ murein hydrolase activator NlpD